MADLLPPDIDIRRRIIDILTSDERNIECLIFGVKFEDNPNLSDEEDAVTNEIIWGRRRMITVMLDTLIEKADKPALRCNIVNSAGVRCQLELGHPSLCFPNN